MKRYLFHVGIVMLLLLGLGGCRPVTETSAVSEEHTAEPGEVGPTSAAEATPEPEITPSPESTSMLPETGEGAMVEVVDEAEAVRQLARENLAQRLEVPAGEIEIISEEAVEWPNAGLGCPLPGFEYAQVTTPGFEIVLQAEEQMYEYHTDEGQQIVLCDENGRPVLPPIPVEPAEIQDGLPWIPVDPPTATDGVD